jgi:hypothetical protein
MKKFLALILVAGIALSAASQTATLMPLKAGDTLVTSSSKDTVTKVITATAGYSALGIQVNATKVSGTINAKAYLYSSLDGTNYNLTDSSAAFADQTTNVAWFTKVTTPYTYYQVQVRNSTGVNTTQSAIVRIYYVLRKHD